ncbi:MAG TPA: hypothetical protein VK631_13170 [Solirubrobacteraceae bacterium]|nr:hypothetical protein [Solirubrobacteraceae bacterium]
MRIRSRSKKRRALDAVGGFLRFKAIGKAARTVRRRVPKRFAKATPMPVKVLPVVAGVGMAGAVAARKRRHHDGPEGSSTTTDEQVQATAA